MEGIRYRYDPQDWATTATPSASDPDLLLRLFRDMLRIRRVEETIEARYPHDEMKTPIHLMIGQEAISTGGCLALRPTDLIFIGHRAHGHYLAKGGDLKAMIAELHGRKTGCAASRGGSMHLVDHRAGIGGASAIIGGIIPLATGAALTARVLEEDRVIATFFGDGASEEGAVWESLNFAALKKLPIIYVCENNFYSVCSPQTNRQPPESPIYRKAAAFGLTTTLVDGTDVLAVYDAMQTAIQQAQRGEGPSLIEARAYRWRGHHGGGDDSASGYRDPQEVQLWQKQCPVERFGARLAAAGLLSPHQRDTLETEIAAEIADAFAFALASPEPEEADLYSFAYSD